MSGPATGLPERVDVVVVGGGVVGCAVARELAGYELDVLVVEARGDVGDGTSKANTAILHTGFDATPGTLEARLVRRGYHLLGAYADATGIPVERTGAILVAWTADELDELPRLLAKAGENGCTDARLVDVDDVYAAVPALGPGALGGLVVPGESIICPWTTTLAYVTDALARGARLARDARVVDVRPGVADTEVVTTAGRVRTSWVVNAAGLGGDEVDRMLGHDRFTVVPRRGELLVFDKLARDLVDVIVLPVPTAKGKGVLVSPTVYGNVMLGPTAQEVPDRADTSTTTAGLEYLLGHGRRLLPALLDFDVTAAYAGLRAATEHSDYVVAVDADQRYVLLGGIRSTGLTASMALAEHVVDLLRESGVTLNGRGTPPPPRMPNIGEARVRPYRDAGLIAADPAYGRIVCFCERVTRGEIRDALAGPVPPCDLDGLRRRTRAMMGRCQGFACGAEVLALLEAGRG